MSRGLLAWDRFVVIVIGLLLLGGGVLAVLWWGGWLPGLPARLDLSPVAALPRQPWWPWAAVLAGLVVVLVGLRWLVAHLARRGVSSLTLPGSGEDGRLRVEAGPLASGFTDAFAELPSVRRARGSVRMDRGQIVARIRATVDPDADLAEVARAADRASAQLAAMLGRDDIDGRVELRVGRGESRLARVR